MDFLCALALFDLTASLQARQPSCIITTSRKKVYTTKRPSKYSNIGTLKNPPFSKKIHVIIRDPTAKNSSALESDKTPVSVAHTYR